MVTKIVQWKAADGKVFDDEAMAREYEYIVTKLQQLFGKRFGSSHVQLEDVIDMIYDERFEFRRILEVLKPGV